MKVTNKPNLSFTANAKDIQQAIQKVMTITQFVDCLDTERRHILLVSGKHTYVLGLTPDAFASVRVQNAEAVADGAIVFDTAVVQGLIKGRDALKVSVEKGKLLLSAVKGRYSASIEHALLDEADVERIKNAVEASKAKKLSKDVITSIRTGIKATELTNFYSDETILAYVKVGEKGVVIECADNFHVACYEEKVESKVKFRFAIPTKTFSLIDRFIGDSEAEFALDGSQLRVQGEGYIVSLPETQVDPELYELVPAYLKMLKDNHVIKLDLSSAAVKTIDNMFAILNEDTRMEFSVVAKGVKIKLSTKAGYVEDAFKADVDGKPRTVHIDPRIFNDLIKKVKGDKVPMTFHVMKKGNASAFKFVSAQGKSARLTQVGTFYDE